jgi:Flp pilus assembly protein TadG
VRRLHRQRGAVLIEMMLVTPILLLILAGIFDFGMLFRSWEVVTNAAREGARVGVLPAYTADDNVRLRVQQYMAASGVTNACTLSCAATSLCTVCVQNQTVTTPAGTFTARSVRVTSVQNLPSLSIIGAMFGGGLGSVPVSSESVMRTETQAAGS